MVLLTTTASSNRNIIRWCGFLHFQWMLLYCYGYKSGGVYWAAVASLLYDLLGYHAPKVYPVGCIWWEGSGLWRLLLRLRLDPDETRCFRSFVFVYLLVIILPSALSSVAVTSTLCFNWNIGCTMAIVTWSGVKDDLLVRGVSFTAVFCEVGAFLRDTRLAFGLGVLAELAAGDLRNAYLLYECFLRVTFEWGHFSGRLCGFPLTSAPLV